MKRNVFVVVVDGTLYFGELDTLHVSSRCCAGTLAAVGKKNRTLMSCRAKKSIRYQEKHATGGTTFITFEKCVFLVAVYCTVAFDVLTAQARVQAGACCIMLCAQTPHVPLKPLPLMVCAG